MAQNTVSSSSASLSSCRQRIQAQYSTSEWDRLLTLFPQGDLFGPDSIPPPPRPRPLPFGQWSSSSSSSSGGGVKKHHSPAIFHVPPSASSQPPSFSSSSSNNQPRPYS